MQPSLIEKGKREGPFVLTYRRLSDHSMLTLSPSFDQVIGAYLCFFQ